MKITIAVEHKEDIDLFRLFMVIQKLLDDDDGNYEMMLGKMLLKMETW